MFFSHSVESQTYLSRLFVFCGRPVFMTHAPVKTVKTACVPPSPPTSMHALLKAFRLMGGGATCAVSVILSTYGRRCSQFFCINKLFFFLNS